MDFRGAKLTLSLEALDRIRQSDPDADFRNAQVIVTSDAEIRRALAAQHGFDFIAGGETDDQRGRMA